jgi:hypothetical protein
MFAQNSDANIATEKQYTCAKTLQGFANYCVNIGKSHNKDTMLMVTSTPEAKYNIDVPVMGRLAKGAAAVTRKYMNCEESIKT